MKKQEPLSFKPRIIRIIGSYYSHHLKVWPQPPAVPLLTLKGYWIHQAGFELNQHVCVTVMKKCIIITEAP